MTTPETQTHMRNAIGQDVPVHMVKEVDKMREALVRDIANAFLEVSGKLSALKKRATDDLEAFLAISAQRFGTDLGGKKGNVTIYSYDGKIKIVRNIQDSIVFDEGLAAARELIDQYLDSLMQGVPGEVRKLIDRAFRPNSAGRISTSAVLGLRSLDINDERWITAMHAIEESIKVVNSKAYIRVFIRDDKGNWQPVKVDFAAL